MKDCGVMDDESGESMEPMEEVLQKGRVSQNWRLVHGFRSWELILETMESILETLIDVVY